MEDWLFSLSLAFAGIGLTIFSWLHQNRIGLIMGLVYVPIEFVVAAKRYRGRRVDAAGRA